MTLRAAPGSVPTLKLRSEFQGLAKGLRRNARAFTVLAGPAGREFARFGFTVTRKVGTATERNRIRRRLKAAVATLPAADRPDIDAVVIARRECLAHPFDRLCAELAAEIGAARRRIADKTRS